VPREVIGAYLLADHNHTPLKIAKSGAGIDVSLPGKALDPIATVLVLSTK
jgi:alpha-L-fucosidase